MNSDNGKNLLTVLVIEDHPDQRDLLAIVLQREGYRVVTAANGLEVLEKLEKESVQIALSDIMMPKMDGFELINKIRSNPELKHIYLILITARSQGGDTALIKISETLREKTRRSDFPSRYGGEEFVLILPETDEENAIQAAKKIHEGIRSCQFGTAARPFLLTVSVGLSSTSSKQYSDWREMLQDADHALYLAKNTGKDRVEIFVPEKEKNSNQIHSIH